MGPESLRRDSLDPGAGSLSIASLPTSSLSERPEEGLFLFVGGRIIPTMAVSKSPEPANRLSYDGRKDFADMIRVNDLEMGRLPCIAWVGQMPSQRFLKVEKLFPP